jgi:hypothetical protein
VRRQGRAVAEGRQRSSPTLSGREWSDRDRAGGLTIRPSGWPLRVADRDDGPGAHIPRDADGPLELLLGQEVPGGEACSQPVSASCEEQVLGGGVVGGTFAANEPGPGEQEAEGSPEPAPAYEPPHDRQTAATDPDRPWVLADDDERRRLREVRAQVIDRSLRPPRRGVRPAGQSRALGDESEVIDDSPPEIGKRSHRRSIGDHHERSRLPIASRRRPGSSLDDGLQQVRRHRFGRQVTHGASGAHDLHDRSVRTDGVARDGLAAIGIAGRVAHRGIGIRHRWRTSESQSHGVTMEAAPQVPSGPSSGRRRRQGSAPVTVGEASVLS